MKEIKFKDIEYRKIEKIEDYKKLRENIENCLTDNKEINIDRLLEYRIEIRNTIDETERNIEMRASYAFPICLIIPSALIGLLGNELCKTGTILGVAISIAVYVFIYGMVVCKVNEFISNNERDKLIFYNTINEILLYIFDNKQKSQK